MNFFPITIGVRAHPELVAWLGERGRAERLSISAMARKLLEEAARRDLQQKDGDNESRE